MPVLIAAFFLTALLYAAVGFGGGSTYAALLALSGMDYRLIPIVALACNILVVAGSTIRFGVRGLVPWRAALGLTSLAAPAALLGGLTPIARAPYLVLLGTSLLLTGLTMLLAPSNGERGARSALARYAPLMAPPLGYLAGLVGIGGGIFLAPLLHLTRWRDERAIAATASLFILVNSLFGLAGQLLKQGSGLVAPALAQGMPLFLAVLIGGQLGSLLASRWLPQKWIRWLTAALVIWVGARLLLMA